MLWRDILPPEIPMLGDSLADRAIAEINSGKTIYPEPRNIFRALQLTPPDKVRVVIVGQDPYHGFGQATGLAFSVSNQTLAPPSLQNIIKELATDATCQIAAAANKPIDQIMASMPTLESAKHDLTPWADAGVLLLNTALTVEEHAPNSHADWGWQIFTRAVFEACVNLPQPIMFLLWGANARTFVDCLDIKNHTNKAVLCSSHPSPLGAYKSSAAAPAFMGSRPFTQTNDWLQQKNEMPIPWLDEILY